MKKFCILAFILMLLLPISCAPKPSPRSGDVEILIFGIGRADAFVIKTQNYVVMIDAGERQHGRPIAQYLQRQNISTIDYLIITHFDGDHVGGAYLIRNNFNVKNVIVPNYTRDSGHVRRFETTLRNQRQEATILTETKRFTLDDVSFILDPLRHDYAYYIASYEGYEEENDTTTITGDDFSIIVSISHGDNNLLFTGDAMELRLEQLLNNNEIMSINHNFLKVPRHGRHSRLSTELIQAISPQYAVITGFHPDLAAVFYPQRPVDQRVIAALENAGAEIFFTMASSVRGISDGTSLVFEYSNFFEMPMQ
ncbi:MAG: MBL fold metallo-hydrolase [Defluviitaleaceae bacterium]|nr:MBL fold metallo-hydrolase [Defluviitaleaceae bacterium]